MRFLAAIAVLISAAVPAAAVELWPQPDTGWRFALTVPAGPGRERFGYVDADPAPPAGWSVTVTCGLQDARTGQILSKVVGRGTSNRGAALGFGGQWSWPNGARASFVITQTLREPESLRLPGEFTAPKCPRRGIGDLSTGD
ncbi:hypothetical protein SAMN02799622_01831 [Methylobacterium sp. UNC378MF]|uniref:Uncharacterized protein n=1 Tax=Methylobacterium oryzae TaxID=334852 RepID=A0ABU7TM11_9HYPH|nr:hypothetical protein [Methylobacterium sp. UNC378MF]SDA17523.1 hypothetical protein SAMN02799622_01831 [Methylobacterium sp. UNC378MF]